MAQTRQNNKNHSQIKEPRYRYETFGSAAQNRVPFEVPEEQYDVNEEKRRRKDPGVRHNQLKQKSFDRKVIGFLTVLLGITTVFCLYYVGQQGEMNSNLKKISALNQQYTSLEQKNDALEAELNASVDYNEIYRRAVEDLGMSNPGKDQVRYFKSTESEYVSQYENIPQ